VAPPAPLTARDVISSVLGKPVAVAASTITVLLFVLAIMI
jgi:hypothetical protein